MAENGPRTIETEAAVTPSGRPLRADARRNRDLIIASARAAFEERGPDASLEEIARGAGVGIGTLYRHFPTRHELLDTVFRDSVDVLCAEAAERAATAPPEEAFVAWLHAGLEHAMTYRSLAASLMITELGDDPSLNRCEKQSACSQMRSTAELQVAMAQDAGVIRRDVDADDIVRMINGIALTTEDAVDRTAVAERLFALMVDGLRT
jgi:AcrR family transcriptional regulator